MRVSGMVSSIGRFFCLITFLVLPSFVFISFTSIQAAPATPRIVMFVPDIQMEPNNGDGWLEVYIDNHDDQIAGFQFALRSTRTDLVTFRFPAQPFDTVGTVSGGAEYVSVIDRTCDSSEYWYLMIRDLFFVPGFTPPFPPQQGGIAVRVPIRTKVTPDQLAGWRCEILFDKPTDFSDPVGNSIGAFPCPRTDTLYWKCALDTSGACSWSSSTDSTCGYDSVSIETTTTGCLDPEIVVIGDGAVTLAPETCDNNGSGSVTVADLTCLLNYLFVPGNPTACPAIGCDGNGSGGMTVADLSYLVNYLFNDGPPPL